MIDELNRIFHVYNESAFYADTWYEEIGKKNSHYITKLLPKALALLPPEFVELYNQNYCLCDWQVENVSVDGLLRQLRMQLSKTACSDGQTRRISLMIEFTEPYPLRIETAERFPMPAIESPFGQGCNAIEGFKFERVPGRKKRIFCSIILQSGVMINFVFKGLKHKWMEELK